ncbi:conserved hypothetical protein [delta proteobacterium NaphS2]|nr:conserved hypothetical protein [delta proteobacterium NaphS2]
MFADQAILGIFTCFRPFARPFVYPRTSILVDLVKRTFYGRRVDRFLQQP